MIDIIRKYINTHCDGVEIISSYVHLQKAGNLYRCCCPFHREKTPSFTVYPKGILNKYGEYQKYETFYCFGCGIAGDVFQFIKNIENLKSDEEVIEFFKDKYQIVYTQDSWKKDIIDQLNAEPEKQVMSLDEINIKTSSACRQYLFYVKNTCPELFEQEFKYIQGVYEKLDDLFYTKPVVKLQDVLYHTEKMLIDRKKNLHN